MTDSTLAADRKWPNRPDFNQFKRQAKELLKAYRSGDASAVAEVQRHEPAPDPAAFALHDAQRVLAGSYGEEIIELLLEHGADINARDNSGRTPIDQMLQNGRQDLAEVLRRHGGESA